MEIVVCIKRVPATDSKIKVGADGRSIDPAGVEFVLNPYDEFAVEAALQLKEKLGAGNVTVVSLGTQAARRRRTRAGRAFDRERDRGVVEDRAARSGALRAAGGRR